MRHGFLLALVGGAWLLDFGSAEAETFGFVPGHYYTTSSGIYDPTINEFDSSGQLIATLPMPDVYELQSLAFGPDGDLYVNVFQSTESGLDAEILAIDAQGNVHQTYPSPINGVTNLLFDDSGHFYLGPTRFDIGSPNSGQTFLPHGSQGIALLPNGHFLAADAYDLYELDGSGTVLRDLYHADALSFVDLRGVAYDASSDTIFATMAGYTGHAYQLMAIDFSSGGLLGAVTLIHGTDLFITGDGTLLAASSNEPPTLYTADLQVVGTLGTVPQSFAIQLVPEPAGVTLAAFGLAACALCDWRRRKRLARPVAARLLGRY